MATVSGHITLVERARGDQWYVKYRLSSGKQVQRRLGPAWRERSRPPAGYFTKRTAEAALRDLLSDAARGKLGDPSLGSETFGAAIDEWLRYVEHDRERARSTVADYKATVERHLRPVFGDEPLRKVTTERIDALREELLAGELSRRTVQKTLVLLHGILARAKRKGWIDRNPAEDAERVSITRSGDFNVLSPPQVFATAAKAPGQMSSLITVAAFTGLRMGELSALRWRDVDFASQTVFVRRNFTHGEERAPKSGKVRSVPLIDQAARALDELSRRGVLTERDDLVFPATAGDHLDPKAAREAFYDALEAAGLGQLREGQDPIVFHDLRHTFGTLGARVWPLHDLQGYMGHSDIQTTMIYVHHVPKGNAAAQLMAAIEAESSPDLAHGERVRSAVAASRS